MKVTKEEINGYEVTLSGWPSSVRRKREVLKTFTGLKDSYPGASFHAVAKNTAMRHELSTAQVLNIAKDAGFEKWKSSLLK